MIFTPVVARCNMFDITIIENYRYIVKKNKPQLKAFLYKYIYSSMIYELDKQQFFFILSVSYFKSTVEYKCT